MSTAALTYGATTNAPSEQSSEQAQSAAVDSLASWTALFQYASEQWTSTQLPGDVWNGSNSATPKSFGTYPPILLYAGSTPDMCGAPPQATQEINLVQAGFLPANFAAAYSGEYCAVVYPDSGTSSSPGPIGTNGGSAIVPASTVIAYFVSGATSDNEGMLSHAPANYVVSHLAPLIANNFAGGGTTMKYAPVIQAGGSTSSPTWQSVAP